MFERVFKVTILILFVFIIVLLYGISNKLHYSIGVGRFQSGDNATVLDTRTGRVYYIEENGYTYSKPNGELEKIYNLPQD